MSSAAANGGNLGTYELIVGPAESPLGQTWIARAGSPGGSASDLVTLRRFGAESALSAQELEVLSEAAEWALTVKQEGVVPTTELVVAGQELAWVRPYVLGEPLRRLLQHCANKKQAPSVEVALRIVVDVLEAVVPIAARPRRLASGALLHCCLLGPDVIWISAAGRSRITDVGVLAAAGSLDRFTRRPDLAAYRAPEQVAGFLAEPRSDVFVAGILLWELISGGRRLFAGEELATVVGAVFASRVDQPDTSMSTNRDVDAGAAAIIMRALDRDPTRRFQDPREMLQAIHELGPGAVAKRTAVAEYLTTVSNRPLSREREIVAQLTASARVPKPSAQEQPAAASDARPSTVPLASGTDPAQVTGSQPARASSPPGARKPDGTAAERAALSSRPSAKKPETGQVQSPRRSWPVPAKKPQTARSQPTEAASESNAAGPTKSAGSHPAAASQRPSAKPNAVFSRPSAEKARAPGIKPVTVSPRPNTTKSLIPRSQPLASSAPPGLGQPARASKPAAAEPSSKVAPEEPADTGKPAVAASPSTSPEGSTRKSSPSIEPSPAEDSGTAREAAASAPLPGSEEPSGPGTEPIAMADGAERPTDTQSDPKAAASPRAAEPAAAASSEATRAACSPAPRDAGAEPAEDETTPSSEPVSSMPILSISETKQEDADERETDKQPAAADTASAPAADKAPPAPATADAATAEGEKGSAAEAESAPARNGVPEPAAPEPEQGRSTWPGFAVETGAESKAAARVESREAAASGEKSSPPAPAAPIERKEPDIAPQKREAAVVAAPFLDEATTRAMKPRFPLAAVLAAAAILAGGLYWLSGAGSGSQEQARPVQPEPEKRAPTVASAPAQAATAAAPESPRAAAPSEPAPTAAEDEMPAKREPEAEPTTKKSPASRHVAQRAKPKPTAPPEAGEPAKVTKAAGATDADRKPPAGSVAPKKTSALDILRRLDRRH
jgi:serine/threonine protein kinase